MHKLVPVTLAGTATHRVKSRLINDELRIDVSLPVEYDDTARDYPVVYLIDSYWFFPIVSQAMRLLELDAEMPPLIIVGIGYEPAGLSRSKEDERVTNLRCRDLTPTRDTSDWWRKAAAGKQLGIGVETGHASEFIQVIENELKPLIYERYRADGADETLAGFSFGGLFALHVLFRHTVLFNRYVAGSPSLWWDNGVTFDFEQDYASRHQDLDKTLFLSMGGLEESGTGTACKMVSNFELLTQRLAARNYASLKWRSVILENENHSTGIAPAFIKGLSAVFRG